MRVYARRGRLTLRLVAGEVQLLDDLLATLENAYDGSDPDDEVVARLYPSAHPDDPDADADYRELTESSLRSERHERLTACRAELAGGSELELADDAVSRRWLQVLNDARLALGTRLGISEDDDEPISADDDPRLVYYWLTQMQDSIVTAVMDRR